MGVFPCRGLGAPCQRAPGSITSDVRFGVKLGGYEMMADTWVKGSDGKWQCLASASAPIK